MGIGVSVNRAMMSQCRSTALSSICATACSMAMRPLSEPGRRRGTSRGSSSSGRSGRAGRCGGVAWPRGMSCPAARDADHAVDQEGRAFDAHEFLAIHALFLPDAERFADLVLGIRQERHREPVLVAEFVVAGDAVLGNARS